MLRRTKVLVAAGVVIVAAVLTAAVFAFPRTPAPSNVLTISGAGTLDSLFPAVGRALMNETAGIQAPLASQSYQGSIAALNAIAVLDQRFDVAAAADYRLIPNLLEPSYATFEGIFASNPEVLIYNPSLVGSTGSPGPFYGINTTNWPTLVQQPGIKVGFANASTDPNGFNEIFVLELEGLLGNASAAALYSHFFTTPQGSLALARPGAASLASETAFASLISAGEIQAAITYQSYAIANHLSYVSLDPSVNLGSLNNSSIAHYAEARTSILTASGGIQTVVGAPVLFAATVPSNAPNSALGLSFLHLLFSSSGEALMTSLGFLPIEPVWVDHLGQVPSILSGEVAAEPAVLPAPSSA